MVSLYELALENNAVRLVKEVKLDEGAVKTLLGNKKKWRPSALAQHPQSQDWYILSSVNKSIVVLDADYKVKSAYKLKHKDYTQPEGIAFDFQSSLWISNEAGDKNADATLLKFTQ